MSAARDVRRLYSAAVLAPVERLRDAPWYADLVGALSAVVAFLNHQPFYWLVLLLIGVNLLDFLVGSAVAAKDGHFNADIARAGAIGKGSGVLLVLIIRGLEGVLSLSSLIDTRGALATAFAVMLIVVDLRSYDCHRLALTGRRTPFLGAILDALQGLAEGLVPKSAKREGGGS